MWVVVEGHIDHGAVKDLPFGSFGLPCQSNEPPRPGLRPLNDLEMHIKSQEFVKRKRLRCTKDETTALDKFFREMQEVGEYLATAETDSYRTFPSSYTDDRKHVIHRRVMSPINGLARCRSFG